MQVMINGEVYAAKMIHEALLETDERGGVESIATKYLRECRLMSRMRHPNINQFVGVCFKAGSRLPGPPGDGERVINTSERRSSQIGGCGFVSSSTPAWSSSQTPLSSVSRLVYTYL